MNNLSDAGSSVLTVVGYTMSGRPADKEHPYGHARMEYLSGLFISVIVTILGVQMLTSSVDRLKSGAGSETYSTAAIIVIGSTILVKVLLALFYYKIGVHIKSTALRASAVDSVSDVITTGAVVAGMLLTPVFGPMTDGVLGCIIAVYIIIMGVKLIIEASNTLLGSAPEIGLITDIIRKIKGYEGVLGLHDLVIHSYGADRCFASVHVEVDAERDIMDSHDIIDNIEADFVRDMNIHMVIHLDPVHTSDEKVNKLRFKVSDIISEIAAEYSTPISMHDFRVVFGRKRTNILFDVAVPADMLLTNVELCTSINEKIKEIDSQYNTVITIDRDYFSTRYGKEI